MRYLIFVLVVGSTLLSPTPASAQWRILEKLSGPGPFDGLLLNWKIVHVNKPAEDENTAPADAALKRHRAIGATSPWALFEVGMVNGRRQETRLSVDLAFSYLWSRDNTLPYRRALSEDERQVRVIALEPAIWVHAARPFQLGFGIGQYWFAGDAFDSFSRVAIQPIRLAVMPLRFMGRSTQKHDALRLEWGVVIFPTGFTAADFGAIGDFRERPDVLWKNVNIVLDFESLFHK